MASRKKTKRPEKDPDHDEGDEDEIEEPPPKKERKEKKEKKIQTSLCLSSSPRVSEHTSDSAPAPTLDPVPEVKGLFVSRDFITVSEEARLIRSVESAEWSEVPSMKRRVQHYGYHYDYKSKQLKEEDKLGDLPHFVRFLIDRVILRKYLWAEPQQLIINEYEPGQGISKHIDNTAIFRERVWIISLGSPCVMRFQRLEIGDDYEGCKEFDLVMEPRSFVLLSGDARYIWTHEIPARKTDKIEGRPIIRRGKRISLTFREVII